MTVNLQQAVRCLAIAGVLVGALSAASAYAAPQNRGVIVPGGAAAETASGDRWAVVNRNATLARGKGVVAVSRGDTASGSYIVTFNKDVTRCLWTATIGLPGTIGVEQPGEITTVRRFNNPRAVYVTTHNSSGAQQDRAFHLFVGCN